MQPPRRPGRPRKPTNDRTVPRSIKGRLQWMPGLPHPLDTMFTAAGDAQAALVAAIERLMDQLVALQRGLHAPDSVASDEERAARDALAARFGQKKHAEHLQATLAAIRRMRLAARFEVAGAALNLARDLLSDLGPSPEEELVAFLAQADREGPRRQAHVAQALATRLAAFEEQVHAQRERLLRGAGWFELHSVTHERIDWQAVRAARQRGEEPKLEDLFMRRTYGPYLDYRWRDGKGPKYTVYLGHLGEVVSEDAGADLVE